MQKIILFSITTLKINYQCYMMCNASPETADCFELLDCFGKLTQIAFQIYRRLAQHSFKKNFDLNLNCT